MDTPAPARKIYGFGDFQLDEGDRLLLRGGKPVPLTPKVADVLVLLLSRAGHVVDREEMVKAVWPDTYVEESSLTRNISQLRKALGEDETHPYIETIPKRGYRFVAEVREITAARPRWKRAEVAVAGAAVLLAAGLVAPRVLHRFDQTPLQEAPFTALPGGEYEPVFSPGGDRIAFVWNGPDEKHYGIYGKPVAGGDAQTLVSDGDDEGSPAWAPDAGRLAFVRYGSGHNDGVYILNLHDKSEHKLAPLYPGGHIYARRLDWSPDGATLAVADKGAADEPFHIDLLNASSGERRRLTTPPTHTTDDTSPVFSPDGRSLAFKRTTDSGVGDVYVVNLGGGAPRRLTRENRELSALDWLPDGNAIVFASKQGGERKLWRVAAGGGTPEPIVGAGNGAQFFSIARKGRGLAYSSWFADTNIWRMDAGGRGTPQRLIASTRAETSAQYSPDGSRIAFRSDQSGATEIWTADASGQNARRLTAFRGPLTGSPRWSPDGQYLAFDSRPEGRSNIYVMASAGGTPRRVTAGPADNVVPSWSRDGKWIYFASSRSGTWQVWKTVADGSGSPVQLTRAGGFAAFEALDGAWVYYAKSANSPGLWRVPSAGGQEEPVLEDLKTGYWGCWGIAQGGIYFVDSAPGGVFQVRVFDPATRRTTVAGVLPKEVPFGDSGFAVSRDGSSFLFTQTDHSGSDLILISNFR